MRLWDVVSRTGIAALTSNDAEINSVAFSRDGKTLAAGSTNGTVRLWDVTTRQQARRPERPRRDGLLGGVQPGRPDLAASSTDGTVRLWDVTTRQQAASP